MPESKMDPNAPRITLGEALSSRRSKINQEPAQAPTPSQYDQMYAALKQNLDLRNMAMVSGLADGAGVGRQSSVPDAIDQVTKLNAAIGPNYNAMLKDQREALIASENARTQAEKREADLRYEMLSRAIADARVESQSIIKNVEEIFKKNQPQAGNKFLFGLADEATGGQFTKDHYQRLLGQQPQKDPLTAATDILKQAEDLKKILGWDSKPPQERVPLNEDREFAIEVLKDKRLTALDEQKLKVEERRIKALESFTDKVGSVIEDAIAGYMASRGGGNGKSATRDKKAPEPEQQQEPQEQIKLEWGAISCPNPDCRSHKFNPPATIAWPTNAPKGFKGQCVYCEVVLGDDGKV